MRRTTIKIGPLLLEDEPKYFDRLTWTIAYRKGLQAPHHQVPAHQYITLIRDISVEMVIGVTKTYVLDGPYAGEVFIDCECVLYIVNEELINEITPDRR